MGNYIYVNVPTVRRLHVYHENLPCIIDGSYAHNPSHFTRALNRKKNCLHAGHASATVYCSFFLLRASMGLTFIYQFIVPVCLSSMAPFLLVISFSSSFFLIQVS